MTIRQFNDPILKVVCEPIAPGEDLSWLKDLERACYENDGAGLAAPQIGIAKRAVFIRYGKEHGLVLINPVLSCLSSTVATESEGCLSYPRFFTPVPRHTSVFCGWTMPNGKNGGRRFDLHEARVLQHEVDHLNGICLVGDAWREEQKHPKANNLLALAAIVATCAGLENPR